MGLNIKFHLQNALTDIKAGDFAGLWNKALIRAHQVYDWVCAHAASYWHQHPLRCGLLLGGLVALVLLVLLIRCVLRCKSPKTQNTPATPLDDAVAFYIDKNKPE